jgi:L-malate glycosyltransferase
MKNNRAHSKSDPIKILYCIDTLLRGGTELQLMGLIARLDRKKYTPYLLTIKPCAPNLIPENCTHLAWGVPTLFSFAGIKTLFQLIRFLKREKIFIVQTFFQDSTIFAGFAAFLARTPVRIACFRDMGFWLSPAQEKVLSIIYKMMNGYIANANVVRDHFIQQFTLSPKNFCVLRNGVDVDSLPFIHHAGPAKCIGIVGNMTREVKRTDLFIKAAGLVNQTHPQVTWCVLGDGHLRAGLEQMARAAGVYEKIHFAGRVDDVPTYLETFDIGVICSDSEGLSNALIEYMFKGVAAVATNVGGNPELIDNCLSGMLIPPDNETALASAIIQLVDDDLLREKITKAAREKVQREYSWEECVKSHHSFYVGMRTYY